MTDATPDDELPPFLGARLRDTLADHVDPYLQRVAADEALDAALVHFDCAGNARVGRDVVMSAEDVARLSERKR